MIDFFYDIKRRIYKFFKIYPYNDKRYYRIDINVDFDKPKVKIKAHDMDWKEVIVIVFVLAALIAIVYLIK